MHRTLFMAKQALRLMLLYRSMVSENDWGAPCKVRSVLGNFHADHPSWCLGPFSATCGTPLSSNAASMGPLQPPRSCSSLRGC